MTEPEINIGKSAGSGETENDSQDGGSSSGGSRGTVTVKGRYGTEQFPPHTECEECGDRAIGVMVHERTRVREEFDTVKPMCRSDFEDYKNAEVADWDVVEFKRFIDA